MTSLPTKIAIHGGGYVGLTAAVHYALAGLGVTIYDPDLKTVDGINQTTPRAGDFLNYLHADIAKLVESKKLKATDQFSEIASCSLHSIAVPTERNGNPLSEIITNCLIELAKHTPSGTTVIVESTLTPGLIDKILPQINESLGTEKKLGENWFLAVCPRRDWFADPQKNLNTLTRVMGGVTPACTQRALTVLKAVSKSILTTDYQTAEICKALENALLHVPVMFAHELAYAMPNKNIAEALKLAGTHWRLMDLHLGFGTGGRCVPLGTKYLVDAAEKPLTIGKRALDFDDQLRLFIAQSIADRVGRGKVLVLGMAYRPEFKDAGLSPGLTIARHLKDMGIDVAVHDPLWSDNDLAALTGLNVRRPSATEDAILLATPHHAFLELPLNKEIWRQDQFVLDAQGAWQHFKEKLQSYGVTYHAVGTAGWIG